MLTEYVAGFLFNEWKTQVLLIEKDHPEWQKGKLNAIGGKMEPGESSLQAMIREFDEEVWSAYKYTWRHRVTLTGPTWRVYFFAAYAMHSVSECHGKTAEPLVVNTLNKLDDRIIPNLRWLIPLCLDEDVSSAAVVDQTYYDGAAKITIDTRGAADL